MNNSMINPSIVDLLKRVEDRYSLVILSAKRARQIIDGAETFVDVESNKQWTIAINEIDEGFVNYKDTEEK